MDKVKRFFWLCSGSHLKTLEEVPSEGAKYAGIGATIFFTGLFAALAGGYAIYTFSDNLWIAIPVGIVWGGMIFNLDRYIVSSMRKAHSWKKEWFMATPRILLALIISLVIARPLELKIFEKEIEAELLVMNLELLQANQDSINQYYNQRTIEVEANISALNRQISELVQKRDTLRAVAAAEADGTGGTMRRNAGPIYRIKKANADRAEQELDSLRANLKPVIAQYRHQQERLNTAKEANLSALEDPDYTGFAARLEALGRLTDKSYSIALANLFIIVLFIAIETAPVMVKLISQKGPYDYRLAEIEYDQELHWLTEKAKKHARVRKVSSRLSKQEQEYIDDYLAANLNKKPASA